MTRRASRPLQEEVDQAEAPLALLPFSSAVSLRLICPSFRSSFLMSDCDAIWNVASTLSTPLSICLVASFWIDSARLTMGFLRSSVRKRLTRFWVSFSKRLRLR